MLSGLALGHGSDGAGHGQRPNPGHHTAQTLAIPINCDFVSGKKYNTATHPWFQTKDLFLTKAAFYRQAIGDFVV